MRLPEIAERLREKALEAGDDELLTLADHIGRRKPLKRAEPTSTPMDEILAEQIRQFTKRNPWVSQVVVAKHFNVNQGRVSEAVRGKRQ